MKSEAGLDQVRLEPLPRATALSIKSINDNLLKEDIEAKFTLASGCERVEIKPEDGAPQFWRFDNGDPNGSTNLSHSGSCYDEIS